MKIFAHAVHRILPAGILLTTGAWTLGCGGGGAGSVTPPSPSPPLISVVLTPQSGTVLRGETLSFTAQVSNSTDTAVSWSVNGIPGGSAQTGVITADGVYTAPTDLPSGGMIHVSATSHADSTKSSTAGVVISSDIAVSLSPASASIELGARQTFQASPNPGPGSVLQIGGAASVTTCDSANSCHAPVFSTDVSAPGSISVQIQNPDKTGSNAANLVACGSGGIDSICFDQADMAFTPGVLAFTRVATADRTGIQIGSGPVSTEVGQILDADIYFNPSDSLTSFATPEALSGSPKSYDLESILTHEIGHAWDSVTPQCGAP